MPVENTQYRGKKILIGRMGDLNLTTMTATKAYDISAFNTNFVSSTKPQKESIDLANNAGQQSADITGSAKFTGTLDMQMPASLAIMLISGVIGTGTQTALTAPIWATGAITAVGNIVKHSNGKYLVAQKVLGDATTGAVEPSITTEVDYDNLAIDGTDASNGVVWKLRDSILNSPDHNTGFCTEKFFIIEYMGEDCGSANIFNTVALNVELTSFNIEKSDGAISQKQSIPWLSTSTKRSSDDDYEAITVTTEIVPRQEMFKADNVTVRVGGAKYGTLHNFSLPYTRNVTGKDSSEPNEQIMVANSPTVSGNLVISLDPAEYAIVQKSDTKSVTVAYDMGDGEKFTATYPAVTFDEPDLQRNGNEPVLLQIMIKPTGNATTAMGTFDVTTATVWGLI